jgi:hypothetical protein
MLEVKVEAVGADAQGGLVVVLRDVAEGAVLPIWVGLAEAQSIAGYMSQEEGFQSAHDLLKTILDTMKVKVRRVVVDDIRDNTYLATIELEKEGKVKKIDARPSDAIALALRADVPIYVSGIATTALHAGVLHPQNNDEEEIQQFERLIEGVNIEEDGITTQE